MADGVVFPTIDPRTGARIKTVTRTSTYGRTLFDGDSFTAAANGWTFRSYKWPFKVDIVEGILLDDTGAGDKCRMVGAPDLSLNAFSAAYGGPSTILNAAITALDKQITFLPALLATTTPYNFIDNGLIDSGFYEITVTDGTNTRGPFLVTSYNRTTGVVTLGVCKKWTGTEPSAWTGFVNGYAATATVKVTRVFVNALELPEASENLILGNYGLSASPFPANVELRIEYYNAHASNPRTVRLMFHLLTGVVE